MKIHVIGAEGYIGRALVAALDARPGVTVTTADAALYGQQLAPRTRHLIYAAEHTLHIQDLDPDVVVLLSATAHDPLGKLSEGTVRGHTCYIPSVIAREALAARRRVVAVSSLSVNSDGAYPEAKRDLERRLADSANFCNRGTILRFGTVFGVVPDCPVETFRSHLLLNNMLFTALATGRIEIGPPQRRRPVIPLARVVRVLLGAIFNNGPYGTVSNHYTTSGTLADYAETVRRFLDGIGLEAAVVSSNVPVVDNRDYGWGWYDEVPVWGELTPLYHYTTKNLKEIESVRDTAWKELYKRA